MFFWIKKEMTRVPVWEKLEAVTLVQIPTQYVVRYKTEEKDGYDAMVIGMQKKEHKTNTGKVILTYKNVRESKVEKWEIWKFQNGDELPFDYELDDNLVTVVWTSKWKWFQWGMKRFHLKWWPETHGSKFHRQIGSMWNRKPRRTMKWHPHAGHMWVDRTTVKKVKILKTIKDEQENLLVLKWSIPGHYNAVIQIIN